MRRDAGGVRSTSGAPVTLYSLEKLHRLDAQEAQDRQELLEPKAAPGAPQ